MYHIFFICSSVNGHLGCFHILAIFNSAAVNTGGACIFLNYSFVQIFTQEWGYCLIWQWYFFFFEEIFMLFSIVAAPIYILINSVGGYNHFLIYYFYVYVF